MAPPARRHSIFKELKAMVVRIKLTLAQEEYSALLKLASSNLRSPEEQLRFVLIQQLKRASLLPEKGAEKAASKVLERPLQPKNHKEEYE